MPIVKQTSGGDGAFDFTSSQLGDFTLVTSSGTASQSFTNLSPGSYSVAETVPDGWVLSNAFCDNGDSPDNITLAAGESVTCTFANVKQDSLTIVKQTQGGDDAFDFTSSSLGDFTLVTKKGEAKLSFTDLNPGNYDVSETVPDGWSLESASCDNGDDPANITLAAGEAVTCTFSNAREDTLIIEKQALCGDGAFGFTSSQLGDFTLTTSNGSASRSFNDLSPGTYAVSETVPSGWDLTGAACDNGDSPDAVTLGAGETVTCRFDNRRQPGSGGQILVDTRARGGDATFTYTSPQLGTYQIEEILPPGWALAGASCSNGDDPSAVTLAAGQSVTCTFDNVKGDAIIIEKRTIGGDGSFAFTGSLGAFTLDTTNGSASQSFTDLSPGTYSVTETVPSGWDLTDSGCDNGDDPASVTLGAGETITCTFENTLQSAVTGVIEVDTQALGGNATFAYSSPQLGSFSATTLNGFASNRFASLTPGSYAVSPVAQAGCSDGSAPDAIDLSAGETVTCTFVYSRQGGSTTLTIAKQTDGGDGTFAFTSAQLGNFNLTTNGGTASRSFTGLAAGSYNVSEGETSGWKLTNATCDNGDSPDNISLSDGETVTCTFSNRLAAAGIPTLSPPALALLAILMTLMAGWARQRGRRRF